MSHIRVVSFAFEKARATAKQKVSKAREIAK